MNKFIRRGLFVLCVLMLQHLGVFSQHNVPSKEDLSYSQLNSGLQLKSNFTSKPVLPILAVALEEVDEEVSVFKKSYKYAANQWNNLFVPRVTVSSIISRISNFSLPVIKSHVPLYIILQVFRI